MQHRSDLVVEAANSISKFFPKLGQAELLRMANQALSEHLKTSTASRNRNLNQITSEDIINFLCNNVGSMACDDVMNSPYRYNTFRFVLKKY